MYKLKNTVSIGNIWNNTLDTKYRIITKQKNAEKDQETVFIKGTVDWHWLNLLNEKWQKK